MEEKSKSNITKKILIILVFLIFVVSSGIGGWYIGKKTNEKETKFEKQELVEKQKESKKENDIASRYTEEDVKKELEKIFDKMSNSSENEEKKCKDLKIGRSDDNFEDVFEVYGPAAYNCFYNTEEIISVYEISPYYATLGYQLVTKEELDKYNEYFETPHSFQKFDDLYNEKYKNTYNAYLEMKKDNQYEKEYISNLNKNLELWNQYYNKNMYILTNFVPGLESNGLSPRIESVEKKDGYFDVKVKVYGCFKEMCGEEDYNDKTLMMKVYENNNHLKFGNLNVNEEVVKKEQ